jgi:histidinol-phosphate phosphatase family protein
MIDVVVPSLGRPSLRALLASLERAAGPRPGRVFLVDDRRARTAPLDLDDLDPDLAARLVILEGGGRGPAAARNAGWRMSCAQWIAFLDDDVVVGPTWFADLARDLERLPPEVAGSQGHVTVPLPRDRRATDWERNVAALAASRWITADCAYRRAELLAVGGFDERFPRAYREDADLALRILRRGKSLVQGTRRTTHPVRPADAMVSVRLQAGNADDVLMDALHGRGWRARAGASPGMFRAHAATVTAAALALLAFVARKPRTGALLGVVWAAWTGAFAWRRIAPGPRTRDEIARMLTTSVLIPFAAVAHRWRGYARLRALLAEEGRAPRPSPAAVLFDRDGTLVVNVPYNGDPARVAAIPGAREALARLHGAGIATAVVSNQSGVALGRITRAQVDAVNARLGELLGPVGPVLVCPHGAQDRCTCRKPAPGLIEAAARALGVAPQDCVVIGDVGADVEAAHAAGARAILVPTSMTRPEEIAAAPCVAPDLRAAVAAILSATMESATTP